jgi:metallophosphoesterase (TIGR00282 family)
MIGDIVGKLGRRTVSALLPDLKREQNIDMVIANGENTAGGRGLTPSTAQELYAAGVDVITSGNHIWENREIYGALDSDERLLRPLNYPEGTPGHGIRRHKGVGVINVMGRTWMGASLDDPFRMMDSAVASLEDCRVIIVDVHAEATSEKIGMGFYLDGRVSMVAGTHTHVPTSDVRVLPKGTGYVTDLGMCGALNSVLGMKTEAVIERFLTQLPNRFEPEDKGPAVFNSVLIDIDKDSGRAIGIERVDREVA